MSRTFSGSCAPAHKNTSAPKNVKGVAPSRKLAKRRKLTADMVDAIYRMARARMFKKADVWGGATMSRAEWRVARTDYKGLGRINAMRCYLALRKQGMLARPAFEQAATLVARPNGKHTNWQSIRKWLLEFVQQGGKLRLEGSGRKTRTRSYLNDPDVREQATKWLRDSLKKMRAKKPFEAEYEPLTVDSFRKWINSTLLKELLEPDNRLRPICWRTARNWLRTLGCRVKSHSECIYYDSHERDDVVQDWAVKLVIARIIDEVTVRFIGRKCEDVVRPVPHPGEPAVVWVSQDESAYHSNDDHPAEWAEEGKGMTLKQKSRGSLLMVSAFISELHGILRCTPAQRDAYIALHPQSHMAARLAVEPTWNGSSTLILEPGAVPGNDKYFDAEQLLEQTKLAMEIFEVMIIPNPPPHLHVLYKDSNLRISFPAGNALLAWPLVASSSKAWPSIQLHVPTRI